MERSDTQILWLYSYLERYIIPRYRAIEKVDKGHGVDHVNYVIRRSCMFAKNVGADETIVYTAAAYHDIGMLIERERHEYYSGKMIRDDMMLHQWFDPAEIEIIAQAAEDHRASSDHEPRSIYGKIVSTADRNTDFDNCIERAYQYREKVIPKIGMDTAREDARKHLLEKYGYSGYAKDKIYFKDPEYEEMTKKAAVICSDPELFQQEWDRVISTL